MQPLRHLVGLTLAGCLMAPTLAAAQPGAGQPPPSTAPGGYYASPPPISDGFFGRRGISIGFGFGLGAMSDTSGPIECVNCDYNPAAFGFDFHIGGMLNPRLALLLEIWGTGQTLDNAGSVTLMQGMFMVAAQYWVTPQLWIKGGLGAADLSLSYDDGYYEPTSEAIDKGGAVMGGLGYEVMSSRRFAIDIHGRIGIGTYDGIQDQITVGTVGVGFNWY